MLIERENTLNFELPSDIYHVRKNVLVSKIGFGKTEYSDVGIRCYQKRIKRGGGRHKYEENSIIPGRAEFLVLVANALVVDVSERLPETRLSLLKTVLGWLDWADIELKFNCTESESLARMAFVAYSNSLRVKQKNLEISQKRVVRIEKNVAEILDAVYEMENFHDEIQYQYIDTSLKRKTAPPSESELEVALSLYRTVLFELFDAIFENRKFPFPIVIPRRFNRKNDESYIFPSVKNFSFDISGTAESDIVRNFWNFETGLVLEPIILGGSREIRAIRETGKRLGKIIDEANVPGENKYRLFLASLAYRAGIMLFCANTGMNYAQVIALNWDENYSDFPVTQGFRGYKARAGTEVEFVISIQFKPTFIKILSLRSYLLRGNTSKLLFIAPENAIRGEVCGLNQQKLARYINFFDGLDRDYSRLGNRKIRTNKASDFTSNYGVQSASDALQNTPATLLENYIEILDEDSERELTSFYSEQNAKVIIIRDNAQEINVGGCVRYGEPEPLIKLDSLRVDCTTEEGCLFCNKYRAVADDLDMWKLLSCQFVVLRYSSVLGAGEQGESMNIFSKRIDEIISFMLEKDRDLKNVYEVLKKKVFDDGELYDYWASKMEILDELGM